MTGAGSLDRSITTKNLILIIEEEVESMTDKKRQSNTVEVFSDEQYKAAKAKGLMVIDRRNDDDYKRGEESELVIIDGEKGGEEIEDDSEEV